MRKICFAVLSIVVVLGFIATMKGSSAYQGDPNLARDYLLQAETSMIQAFLATQEANRAGADVSKLKENLTTVLDLLEGAQIAYDKEEFSTSTEFSRQAVNLANEINAEALNLTAQGKEHSNIVRYTTIAYFVLADFSICIAGLYLINKIYKYHYDRFLKKRPKIESGT